ncbi:hypothetical protein Scep_014845 [Stephania cephalantha]|uniref:Uncharacterized protein n=1 Tax=Stephania cephalantha TaxID=152367 RepID=A0AAP0J212_9MAGN
MAGGLFVHLVFEMAALLRKRDEVGEYGAAITDVEERVGGAGDDVVLAVELVHVLLRENKNSMVKKNGEDTLLGF